ncbi:MAG: phage minor head protein [Clostridia bacterium]|nr:phage minor head protein [Clostridia bacterium]
MATHHNSKQYKIMDYGHEYAEQKLIRIERRIQREYQRAYTETKAKLDKYLAEFAKADSEARKSLTADEYREWRRNRIMTGKRWEKMVDTLAQDYANASEIAAGIVRGELNDVFALNANYTAWDIETGLDVDYGFTLYDKKTVENLLKENPNVIPRPQPDIPKELRWNRQKITSSVLQGVLQGEPIPNISKRLRTVAKMDTAQSIRTARTAVTGAQNAGRQTRYDQAKEMGLPLKKRWIATLDGRTRHEHGMADGLTVELDDVFLVGGEKLMHPGDFSKGASGWNVYNCRCTMRTVDPKGGSWKRPNRETYQEWYKRKGG